MHWYPKALFCYAGQPGGCCQLYRPTTARNSKIVRLEQYSPAYELLVALPFLQEAQSAPRALTSQGALTPPDGCCVLYCSAHDRAVGAIKPGLRAAGGEAVSASQGQRAFCFLGFRVSIMELEFIKSV